MNIRGVRCLVILLLVVKGTTDVGRARVVSSRMSTHSDSIMYPRELVRSRTDSIVDGNDNNLDPSQFHYCTAYSAAELKTFHCDGVRKTPLSALCRDEADWWDFRRRESEVSHLYSFCKHWK